MLASLAGAAPLRADSLVVPGGYEALLAAAGIRAPVEPARTLPLIVELSQGGLVGVRMARAVRAYADQVRKTPPPSDLDAAATLPGGTAFWASVAKGVAPRDLVWEILTRRDLALLYYGLHTMDERTVASIAADPALGAVFIRYASLLPSHGRGIRIADGRVIPAGGEDLAAAWSAIVGEPLDQPAAFARALLSRDAGRLAHFFKVVGALSAPQVRFVAGAAADVKARGQRLADLYEAFARSLSAPEGQGVLSDEEVASVLFSIAARDDGHLAGPPWSDFWRRAFSPGRWSETPLPADQFDPAHELSPSDVLRLVCGSGRCDGARVETLLFVQRQFPRPQPADAGAILTAAWVRGRYPALALEIERLRLDDPSVYLALGRAATALERLGGSDAVLATIQLQGALAVLGRLRRVGAPAAFVAARIHELAALEVDDHGYRGRLARWLFEQVLVPRQDETADDAAIRHLSGAEYRGAEGLVEWEGQQFRVDLATTEARRLRAARARFRSHRLELARQLSAPGMLAAEARGLVRDVDDGVRVQWDGQSRAMPSVRDRASRNPALASEVVLADALVGLVYALALEDPENSAAAGPEVPRRHVFSRMSVDRGASLWQVPEEQHVIPGGPHVLGALLALDLGAPSLAVRRLAVGRPAEQSNLSRDSVRVMFSAMAMTSIWTASEASAPLTGVSISPCLCLMPASERTARLGLKRRPRDAAEATAAPSTRVMDELVRRRMPAVLAPGVLRLLLSDLVENTIVAYPDDLSGVDEYLRRMTAARFDDYIAAIAARGPLVPVEGPAAVPRP